MKPNNSYQLYLGGALFLIISSTLVLLEYFEVLAAFIGVILLLALSIHTSTLIPFFILTIPLSVNYALPGGVRINLPSEFLLLYTSILIGYKTISGFRLSFKIWDHPIGSILLLDLSWTLITTLLSDQLTISIKRLIIKILFILVFYYIIPQILKNKEKLHYIFYLYGIGLIIPIIYTTYQHFNLGLGQDTSILVSLPFYDEHTIYAACVTFIIPFFLIQLTSKSTIKIGSLLLLGLLGIAFFLSYSRAAWLSILLAGGIGILIRLRVSLFQFVGMTLFTLVLFLLSFNSIYKNLENNNSKYDDEISTHLASVTNLKNDASNLERINRWVSAYRMFQAKPFFGFGPGTYQFTYNQFQSHQFMTRISTTSGNKGNAHSEYLTTLSENGMIGLGLFLTLIITSFISSLKVIYSNLSTKDKSIVIAAIMGLCTFYFHGLFNAFIDSTKMAFLVYSSLGIIAIMHNKLKFETD